MADISDEIQAISSAVYGSQVRSSIIDALTKINAHVERISMAKSAGVYRFRGSVATASNLPITGIAVGDCYFVSDQEVTYAWTGSAWNSIGEIFERISVNTGGEELAEPIEEELPIPGE